MARSVSLVPFLVILATGTAGAQTPAPADQGGAAGSAPASPQPEKLPWAGTNLTWSHTATAETVGVGRDVITRNPTYDMAFTLGPRYVLWEQDRQSVTLSGSIGAAREFTNSDVTTRRGEWSLTDATLGVGYSNPFLVDGDTRTTYSLRLPSLTFPTSKVSQNNGRYLGLGASTGLKQSFPLLGSDSPALRTASVGFTAGYSHWLTRAVVPTNDELERVRLTPDGVALPGDQLSGAAFPQHQVNLSLSADVSLHERVSWSNSFGWRPTWKYSLQNDDLCVVIANGCAEPSRVDSPQRYSVVTVFSTEISVDVLDEMALSAGYSNSNLQIGPDGQRQNFFYSPSGALFTFSAAFALDVLYQDVSGSRSASRGVRLVAGR